MQLQKSFSSLLRIRNANNINNLLILYLLTIFVSLLLYPTPIFAHDDTNTNDTIREDGNLSAILGNSIAAENAFTYSYYNMSIKISNSTKNLESCGSSNYSELLICIPKCCPFGQVLDYGGGSHAHHVMRAPTCADSGGTDWSPSGLFANNNDSPTSSIIMPKKAVAVFHKKLICTSTGLLYLIHEDAFSAEELEDSLDQNIDRFHIFPNGTIHSESGLIFSDEVCLEGVQNFDGGDIQPKYSGNHGAHVVLGVCLPEDVYEPPQLEDIDDRLQTLIYWVILPFASLFLLATIIIYILVWDTHNIHGYTLFSYVVSLFGNYCVLFISQIGTIQYNTPICTFIGICTHFFFLMTAAWLTVVNFDVWHTFKHLKAGRPSKKLKRYFGYFLFAVGSPFILVFISGLLDNAYKNDSFIILPNYGDACVLSNSSVAFYLYIPLALLLCANLTFFISTIFLLIGYKRSIGAVLKGTCTAKEDQSLRLFLKLFVVMGFSWTFEVVGWGVKRGLENYITGISTAVAIVDVFNLLLAIPIFFIFVWKKTIFDQLWIQYPSLLRKPLGVLVFCGCVDSTPDDKRPSLSVMTMSTLPRNGTIAKNNSSQGGRMSSGSVSELIANRNRKRSNDSQSSGESWRKFSQGSVISDRVSGIMSVVVEHPNSENVDNHTEQIADSNVINNVEVSHHPNNTEVEPCPKI